MYMNIYMCIYTCIMYSYPTTHKCILESNNSRARCTNEPAMAV